MIVQTMAIDAPDAGALADQHHVDDRQAHRSAGSTRRCCPCCSAGAAAAATAYIEGSAAIWALIGSPLYPADPRAGATKADETYDRGVAPAACCAR